jgi:hypothetical protein
VNYGPHSSWHANTDQTHGTQGLDWAVGVMGTDKGRSLLPAGARSSSTHLLSSACPLLCPPKQKLSRIGIKR